jgi:hypothetical protein
VEQSVKSTYNQYIPVAENKEREKQETSQTERTISKFSRSNILHSVASNDMNMKIKIQTHAYHDKNGNGYRPSLLIQLNTYERLV